MISSILCCWYAERSLDAADAFDSAVDHAIRQIARTPERFPKCDDVHRYFLMQRFPFRIIYKVVRSEIIVISISHTSREPAHWKHR
ncbi:type II toxin-antitoxin system RelE/ParE family toxin [Adhaeretor mobilis]|uniref:Plasmid stabilization system protein n=1 Tax=Adhaeretor mobilis TaxID=1930276 RepID=A0A517N2J2_9BACT|nr:type II toxin-antitoxin system RelE/ParE family toxin [Adhaeretor mobilis]QDT01359.1 Plasmid stabilization system protein [Adhaeretor mobilis]